MRFACNIGALAAFLILSGCAHGGASGSAPASATGQAQSNPKIEQPQKGERMPTETLTPGVGSALFPDPAWR